MNAQHCNTSMRVCDGLTLFIDAHPNYWCSSKILKDKKELKRHRGTANAGEGNTNKIAATPNHTAFTSLIRRR